MSGTRRFHVGAVLSVTHGNLMCPMSDLYEILNWITDDNLFTHQLPRAGEEAAPLLRELFPDLAAVVIPDRQWKDFNEVRAWLSTLGEQWREVPRMAASDHARIDPVLELQHMVGADKVIEVWR